MPAQNGCAARIIHMEKGAVDQNYDEDYHYKYAQIK